jgi:hypothetical protein
LPPASRVLADEFASASPFPHAVIDNVLALPAHKVAEALPAADWPHWRTFTDGYQKGKSFCQDIEQIPELFSRVIADLSAPSFLAWVEKVTGIPKLIPDPYLEGGGVHRSVPGGTLAPHTDFHLYPRLGLYRQVNVLLYLNPEWREEWGGCLELWRKGDEHPTKFVVPTYGRLVLFRTDDRSVHGFSNPVTDGGPERYSIALYYYTAEETNTFAGDTSTHWQQHGNHGRYGRARLFAYRTLLFTSRGLAMLAHRANPNVGFRHRQPD